MTSIAVQQYSNRNIELISLPAWSRREAGCMMFGVSVNAILRPSSGVLYVLAEALGDHEPTTGSSNHRATGISDTWVASLARPACRKRGENRGGG